MKEKENIPKIRFKGFTDAWEQRKLKEVSNIYDGTHQTPNYTNNGVMFLSVENIKNLTSEKYISEEDFKNNFKIYPQKNDILMTRIGDIGTTNIVRDNSPKAYYVSLALLKPINIEPEFLNISISSDFVQQGLRNRSLLTAIPVKINKDQIGEVDIKFPTNSKEQQYIGSIFKNIDNLITLHQRKCDNLINIKKSMLEKMFPKNSSKLPEIRFKGFTDVWEQRKFENVFNYERPDKYIVKSTEYLEFGPIPVLTANKAFILGYTNEKNIYLNSKESIIFDDFTLDTKFVDFPYMVKSSAIKILTLKDEKNDNLRFNYELLSKHKFNMLGHARHYISVVQPEEIYTTKKEEQDKISKLLTDLDNLITLHQRKLEKLNQMKKSLLDKMFV